jgi:hypothetical protein
MACTLTSHPTSHADAPPTHREWRQEMKTFITGMTWSRQYAPLIHRYVPHYIDTTLRWVQVLSNR